MTFNFRAFALMAVLVFACLRADAQGFGISATNSPNPVVVNNSLTYTIGVTNQTGLLLSNFFVTNTLSASVQFLSASSSYGSNSVNTNSTSLIFTFGQFANGDVAQITVTLQPQAAGFLTNYITVASADVTNTAVTNIVAQVITAQADLGVTLTGPAQAVITNDFITYGVTVTNLGPSAAPNVVLTNTLPPGVILIGVFPTNQTYTIASSNLIYNLGTLANDGSANLQFTVQPTNAGVLIFSASVGASGLLDANSINNAASTNITVGSFSGQLIATNVSSMAYNPQTGLMNQTINLSNIGTNAVASARVIVSGLTNWLYNAVGTNNGNPFVVYGSTLGTNQSVNLVLDYFVPTRLPVTVSNSQYIAVGVPAANISAPAGTNGVFNITRIVTLTNGNVLVEFQSVPGSSYTILYSGDMTFSNALEAQPSIIAPADRVQWIDDGPPKTVSAPTNNSSRFYRVLLNQ